MPHLRGRAGLIATVAFILPGILHAQTVLADSEYVALGRKYYDWFIAAEADSLLSRMSPEAQEGAGGVSGVNQAVANFLARAGAEEALLEERVNRRRGHPQYWRESRYSTFGTEPIVFRFVLDEKGWILGVGMGPKSGTPAPD